MKNLDFKRLLKKPAGGYARFNAKFPAFTRSKQKNGTSAGSHAYLKRMRYRNAFTKRGLFVMPRYKSSLAEFVTGQYKAIGPLFAKKKWDYERKIKKIEFTGSLIYDILKLSLAENLVLCLNSIFSKFYQSGRSSFSSNKSFFTPELKSAIFGIISSVSRRRSGLKSFVKPIKKALGKEKKRILFKLACAVVPASVMRKPRFKNKARTLLKLIGRNFEGTRSAAGDFQFKFVNDYYSKAPSFYSRPLFKNSEQLEVACSNKLILRPYLFGGLKTFKNSFFQLLFNNLNKGRRRLY